MCVPSEEISKSRLLGLTIRCLSDHTRGFSTTNVSPFELQPATIKFRLAPGLSQNSSRPFCSQRGHIPIATGHLPGPETDFTNTSGLPDSFDINAIHRPSGEKVPPPSLNLLWTRGSALPALGFSGSVQSIGMTQRSIAVSGFVS